MQCWTDRASTSSTMMWSTRIPILRLERTHFDFFTEVTNGDMLEWLRILSMASSFMRAVDKASPIIIACVWPSCSSFFTGQLNVDSISTFKRESKYTRCSVYVYLVTCAHVLSFVCAWKCQWWMASTCAKSWWLHFCCKQKVCAHVYKQLYTTYMCSLETH